MNPATEMIMRWDIIIVPSVCLLLGFLTGLTLARPEPGSRPPNDNLPITAWPKTPGQSKPKAK